jgi:nucleoside-diphosphate-sugar epimerase
MGSRGFIASRLIQRFGDAPVPCRPVGADEVDLTEHSAREKLCSILHPDDCVIVCSALTPEKGRNESTFTKNVRMIENLCAALESVPCGHVIYISSDSVYDPALEVVTEESPCVSEDWYARSHTAREALLRETCRSINLPLAILRPCAVYGPGDTHNSYGPNRFIRSALTAGKICLFGEGEELRDHVYVDDLTKIVMLTAVRRSAGILNVATGKSHSFRELAALIVNAAQNSVVIETEPRRIPVTHRRFDIVSLRQTFPEFHPVSLESGICEMMDVFPF